MRFSAHLLVGSACALAGLGTCAWSLLSVAPPRPTPVVRLTVRPEVARPPLATADAAIGPVVPSCANVQAANPFVPGERGGRTTANLPEPPPPPIDLPAPPATPFIGMGGK